MSSKLQIVATEDLQLCNGKVSISLFADAAVNVNIRLRAAIASTGKVKLDLYEIIDLRMLSGLIGEMFSAEVSKLESRLIKNPNIDGYPDLCDISKPGKKSAIDSFSTNAFLAYDDGGFEVKNTFGVKKSNTHIIQGESRLTKIQKKLVWKAHHRETNNLIAIHSDNVNKVPQIIAAFYTDKLEESDWTVKQQPKEGSTMTSFCQTTPSAFSKLKNGLMFFMEGIGHEQFLR